MPAITDYASLLSEVADYVDRTDLATRLPRFIQMTEAELKRKLRTLDMETTVEEEVEEETFELPDDCLSVRAIHIKGDPDEDEPNLPLTAYSPAAFAIHYDGIAGTPNAYTRIGNTIRLAPAPHEDLVPITLEILYLARFAPLTEDDTNWIFDNHPDVYFYGVLAQALAWDQNEEAGTYGAMFAGAIESLIQSRAKDRWGPGVTIPSPVRQVAGARC